MRTTRCPEVVPKECSAHNSKLGWAASFFGTQDQRCLPALWGFGGVIDEADFCPYGAGAVSMSFEKCYVATLNVV
jgi:hypothetical protein